MSDTVKPLGRGATLALGVFALLAGQLAALLALTWYFGQSIGHLPDFSGDGAAITLVIAVSTPVEVALMALFARRTGASAAVYLGLIWPRRGEVVLGVGATIALMIAGNLLSWLLGRGLVTPFQLEIYTTASAGGWLLWLWLAVVSSRRSARKSCSAAFCFAAGCSRRKTPGPLSSSPRCYGRSFMCNTTGT